ncbi:MAG TPA: peptidase M16, partial [Cryomorphaceae bacterium]|nr:peptidase M16 [Cryomorphaceae bacterium]
DPDEAKELIKKYFSDIEKGSKDIPRPKPAFSVMNGEMVDTVYDNIQLPAIFLGYRIPGQSTKDSYALEMLTTLLSDGQSSRMYKTLVDGEQLAIAVQTFPFALENGGLFVTLGVTNMGVSLGDLKNGIDREVERVRNEMISEKEYEKVLNQLENDFISRNSTMAGIAESLANYHVYYGDANLINTEIKKYREITREDLQRVANTYLVNSNRVVLYYLPKKQ